MSRRKPVSSPVGRRSRWTIDTKPGSHEYSKGPANPRAQFGPLAKSLEDRAKRELTETAFVVVAAGGESTKTALFLGYTQRRGWIDPG
jgi:hypothetical protein